VKIAIVTIGTRGDVQPYVAVGKALQARGHDVWVAAHDEYKTFIEGHGLGHRSMHGSFRGLLESDLGRAWLSSSDSPIQYARHGRALFEPLVEPWCRDADDAVEGADAVAFYAIASGALYAAQRRGLPAVAMAPWPIVPSRKVVLSPSAWMDRAPGFIKHALGRAVARIAFGPLNAAHLAYRARVGLRPYRAKDPLSYLAESGVPTIHLFSEEVIRRPADWDTRHQVAGFAFLDGETAPTDADLAAFLEKPAIYVGFGSMTGVDPGALSEIVTRALALAGVRAVVARGWAGLTPRPSKDVFVIDEAPHEWLFRRVDAVVHHGGVGTFAEGLRAGRPNVIAAFFADQPFWGSRNEQLGTGPPTILRKTLSAERLAAAIRRASQHRPGAEAIGRRLRDERGAERAADMLLAAFAERAACR
jgi:sterol 3beta-glucosyltransferase